MQHVDEGILHAYLDGELGEAERREVEVQVKACATCADGLAEARRVRDRAVEILGSSAAALEVPPFEQVLKRRAGGSGSRLRRLRIIGLAATLAVAVGVVWFARDAWVAGGAGEAGERAAGAAEAAGRQSGGAAEAAGTADRVGAASQTPRPAATPVSPPSAGGGEDARRQEADRTVLADAPADSGREPREAEEERAAERRFPAEGVALEQIVVTAAPTPKAADEVQRRDSAAALRPEQQPSAAAAAESGLGLRLRGFVHVDAESDWAAVDEDSAAAHLGRRPGVVPDLPVVAFGIRQGDPARAVRVIQSLGDGMVIELIERTLAEADAEVAGRMMRRADNDWRYIASFLPDSAATVRIELDGYEIIGRANLPAESLRVLVERIR